MVIAYAYANTEDDNVLIDDMLFSFTIFPGQRGVFFCRLVDIATRLLNELKLSANAI